MYLNKYHTEYLEVTELDQAVTNLLSESEKASGEGNNEHAYKLSLLATQTAPENIEAWLVRAALSPSFEERVICINHLNELAPDHFDRNNIVYFTLKELMERNPFIGYHEETDQLYRVVNGDRMMVSIQKKRSTSNTSFLDQPNELRIAYRWLTLAFMGLLLAGVGTLIFAPLAALSAIQAGESLQSRSERVNSVVILLMSILLFFVGAVFSLLFVIHWTG